MAEKLAKVKAGYLTLTKDAYIERLENTIKDLTNQVNNLTEMILLLRREKFASSSEKTPKQTQGQLSLFL